MRRSPKNSTFRGQKAKWWLRYASFGISPRE